MRTNTKKLILCALFAALACVATLSIRIPTPGTGGYIHPGDAIVIDPKQKPKRNLPAESIIREVPCLNIFWTEPNCPCQKQRSRSWP